MAQLSQSLQWDPVPGAADYRVRAADLSGNAVGTVAFTPATTVILSEVFAGVVPGTYVVYVAAKDVAGAGNGTPGSEAQLQLALDGLPAPSGLILV